MSKKNSNPLFFGQNFTENKIPGSKNWFIVTNIFFKKKDNKKIYKKTMFDPLCFDKFYRNVH